MKSDKLSCDRHAEAGAGSDSLHIRLFFLKDVLGLSETEHYTDSIARIAMG